MATNVFQITPYSSFRFANENPSNDPKYHYEAFDDRLDPLNYFQKIQTTDTNFHVQLLSDFTPTLALYTCHDELVKTITLTTRTVTGATYLVYDADIDFSDVTPDDAYYLKLTYTDETSTAQDLRSSPIELQIDHPDTLRYEYTNTYNDKGVVFINNDNSQLVFAIRVEGNLDEYQPLSDDVTYIDQVHDDEVLNNVPYDNWKNYIGCPSGIPDWLVRKMNLVFTLNKVKVEKEYFNRVEGSKFTPVRPQEGGILIGDQLLPNRPTYWSIDIIPNENFNLGVINTGDTPTGDLVVIKRVWPEPPNQVARAASFSISGIFNRKSNLIRVAVENTGLDVFEMLLGTTLGGAEIATLTFDINPDTGTVDLTSSHDIGAYFSAPTTIYVTIPSGVNIIPVFDYNQYDAQVVNPVTPTGGVAKGTVSIYEEITPGDFALDWDLGTGLGLRNWVGWCLSGTNGTKNRAGKYSQGWDKTLPMTRGTSVGANEIELTRAQLPAEGIELLSAQVNSTNGDIPTDTSFIARANDQVTANRLAYELHRGTIAPTLGLSADLGSGDPVVIEPDSWIDVWVVKITD